MKIEFDPVKNQRNIEERGLSFEQAQFLEWHTALVWRDTRTDYGEVRWNALAYLGERLHAICFKMTETNLRVISFRKANKREMKKYEQERY